MTNIFAFLQHPLPAVRRRWWPQDTSQWFAEIRSWNGRANSL